MEEISQIDYKILELLTKAPSKKYLRKFLEYCFLLRNKVKIIEELLKTPVANQFCSEFQLTEDQAHQVYEFPSKFNHFFFLNSLSSL